MLKNLLVMWKTLDISMRIIKGEQKISKLCIAYA